MPQSSCCTAPGRLGPASSTTPPCSPTTVMASYCSTPEVTVAAAAGRWTSAGTAITTRPQRSRSSTRSPTSTMDGSRPSACRWAARRRSARPQPSPDPGGRHRGGDQPGQCRQGVAMDQYGWRGAIQEGIEWLTYSATDLLTDAEPPIALHDAVAMAAPRPVLLIAAGNVESEGHASRYIAGASPETVDVWVVPDTGHTGALDTDPDAWEYGHDLPRRRARRQQYGRFLANSSPRGRESPPGVVHRGLIASRIVSAEAPAVRGKSALNCSARPTSPTSTCSPSVPSERRVCSLELERFVSWNRDRSRRFKSGEALQLLPELWHNSSLLTHRRTFGPVIRRLAPTTTTVAARAVDAVKVYGKGRPKSGPWTESPSTRGRTADRHHGPFGVG